jgi:hypothetical protein
MVRIAAAISALIYCGFAYPKAPDVGFAYNQTGYLGMTKISQSWELLSIGETTGLFCSTQVGVAMADLGAEANASVVHPMGCDSIDDYHDKFVNLHISGGVTLVPFGIPVLPSFGLSAGGSATLSLGLNSAFFTELAQSDIHPVDLKAELKYLLLESTAKLVRIHGQKAIENTEKAFQQGLKWIIERSLLCSISNQKKQKQCLPHTSSPSTELKKEILEWIESQSPNAIYQQIHGMYLDVVHQLASRSELPNVSEFFQTLVNNINPCGAVSAGIDVGITASPTVAGLSVSHYQLIHGGSNSELNIRKLSFEDFTLSQLEPTLSSLFSNTGQLAKEFSGPLLRDTLKGRTWGHSCHGDASLRMAISGIETLRFLLNDFTPR